MSRRMHDPPRSEAGADLGHSLPDDLAAFVAHLAPRTARAYLSDLKHLNGWLGAVDRSIYSLTDGLLVRYLGSLRESGYAESSIRRRVTAVRSFAEFLGRNGVSLGVDVDTALPRLRLAAPSDCNSTSVLVVSDDALVRIGLTVAAKEIGIIDVTAVSQEDVALTLTELPQYDYAIVHMWLRSEGLDRLPGVEVVAHLHAHKVAAVIVVLASFEVTPLLRLRVAEAGCGFLCPYDKVRSRPEELLRDLSRGTPPAEITLPSQWAIREELDLRWNGEVAPLLALAAELPTQVWTTYRAQTGFALSRSAFRSLRLAARDVAGLREPPFDRYATSVRKPPDLPEWSHVKEFVRGLWGHPVL